MNKITTGQTSFYDEHGRVRIFNGYNFPAKEGGEERYPFAMDDAFLDQYVSLGFDVMRLGLVWENIEPQPGVYNETYLRSIDGIFDRAAQHGVYVFLDMHQDLYANFPGSGGDGAPAWATITNGVTKPRKTRVVWAENYIFNKAVRNAYDNFWANTPVYGKGLQDHFAAMWQMLARRYGDHPALFGFDFLNEPFGGSYGIKTARKIVGGVIKTLLFSKKINRKTVFGDLIHQDRRWHFLDNFPGEVVPDVTQPAAANEAEFGVKVYAPFLSRMAAAVRKETANGIIMMEQSIFSNGGVPMETPVITIDGKQEPQQCYSPHSYDITVDTEAYQYANNSRVGAFFTQIARNQERLGTPVLVGEWGQIGADSTIGHPHAQFLLDFFDRHQWSQTYWAYAEGHLDSQLMEVLSRTHPIAVAGKIKSYATDQENNTFTLRYVQAEKIAAPTEIYVHKPYQSISGGEVSAAKTYASGASVLQIHTAPGEQEIVVQY